MANCLLLTTSTCASRELYSLYFCTFVCYRTLSDVERTEKGSEELLSEVKRLEKQNRDLQEEIEHLRQSDDAFDNHLDAVEVGVSYQLARYIL